MKKVIIIGGGTISHVRAHMAICAPAYGTTAKMIKEHLDDLREDIYGPYKTEKFETIIHLTKMAGGKNLETNLDIKNLVSELLLDEDVKVIIFNPALCDFDGQIGEEQSGKYAARLKTKDGEQTMKLKPADKVISIIKKARSDIVVVGFKTTNNSSEEEQYERAKVLLEESGCDLVLANDLSTRNNLIVNYKGHKEYSSTDRGEAIVTLTDITLEIARI